MSNLRRQKIRGVRAFMKQQGITFENPSKRNDFIIGFLKSMNATYKKGEYGENVTHHADFDNNAYNASTMFDNFVDYCMKYKRKLGKAKPKPKKGNGFHPDWSQECEVCGQVPIIPMTGMCAVCTYGEADAQFELIENGEI